MKIYKAESVIKHYQRNWKGHHPPKEQDDIENKLIVDYFYVFIKPFRFVWKVRSIYEVHVIAKCRGNTI